MNQTQLVDEVWPAAAAVCTSPLPTLDLVPACVRWRSEPLNRSLELAHTLAKHASPGTCHPDSRGFADICRGTIPSRHAQPCRNAEGPARLVLTKYVSRDQCPQPSL